MSILHWRRAFQLRTLAVFAPALAPSAWLAWSWRAMPHLGLHHDDTIYLASAKSLAEGHGYRIASLPGEPFQTKYPPVLPLLLAAVWKVAPEFPENLNFAMLLAWLMIVPYLLCMRAVFRFFQFGEREVWMLTLLAASHPVICLLSTVVMSDLLFLALFLMGLLLAERALQSNEPNWLACLSGVIVGLAYLTRTAALPALVTCPLCFLYR